MGGAHAGGDVDSCRVIGSGGSDAGWGVLRGGNCHVVLFAPVGDLVAVCHQHDPYRQYVRHGDYDVSQIGVVYQVAAVDGYVLVCHPLCHDVDDHDVPNGTSASLIGETYIIGLW